MGRNSKKIRDYRRLRRKYKDLPWFMDLVDNVTRFEEFKLTPEYKRQKYESKLISKKLFDYLFILSYSFKKKLISLNVYE